jgi:lysophospholipid acyltransferase (LPLAT)-like uncharacterized protein
MLYPFPFLGVGGVRVFSTARSVVLWSPERDEDVEVLIIKRHGGENARGGGRRGGSRVQSGAALR